MSWSRTEEESLAARLYWLSFLVVVVFAVVAIVPAEGASQGAPMLALVALVFLPAFQLAAFLLALKDVVETTGGMSAMAKRVGLKRPSLYKVFSKRGNPTLETLQAILAALGLRVTVATAKTVATATGSILARRPT